MRTHSNCCPPSLQAVATAFALALSTIPLPAFGAEPAEVRIGGTLPLSGPEAVAGAQFREGYELAVDEVNERGGVLLGGRKVPVSLRLRDDASDKTKAVALAEELMTADGLTSLLGTFSSANVELQSLVAEKHRVPYVAGSGAAAGLFQRKLRFLFGLQSPVKMLSATILDWMASEQNAGHLPTPTRIALVWEKNVHGEDFRAGVLRYIERRPSSWKVVLDESFEMNTPNFAPVIARLKAAQADAFLADAHLPDFIAMHRQYLAAGLCHPVVTYGARGTEKEAADALGAENVDFILSAVWWDDQLGGSGPSQTFVDRFRKKHRRSPRWQQAVSYEAARALLTAIERAGTTQPESVREALESLRMPSILPIGTLTFPGEYGHQAHYPFVVLQNQPGGRSPIVFPSYLANGQGVVSPRCGRGPVAGVIE